MKKSASIFLKSRKFIIPWFVKKCVAKPCVAVEEYSAILPISTYNVGVKLRKETLIF